MSDISIDPLRNEPETVSALTDVIVDTVAGGASVSFMAPLSRADAAAFWSKSLAAAERGERIILGAHRERLLGTVTLLLDTPPNQPHRGEIAKLMTCPSARGLGIGTKLMHEAERIARKSGRWLLTLDSATVDGAGPFYEKLGYVRAGVIPDYALTPSGKLSGTIIYYKCLR